MPKHVKPTTEELEAQALEKAKEVEDMMKDEEAKNPPEEKVPEEEAPPEEEKQEEKQDEESTNDEEEKKRKDVDYKKKFIENQREAIILASKNKKLNEAIDNASKIDKLTDEELTVEYPEWEEMSDTEKKLARETLISKRRFSLIQDANKESRDIEAWHIKVDEFLIDPQTLIDIPELEGKTEDFRIFAMKNTKIGTPLDDLVKSFLWTESNVPKKQGKMIEDGTGGDNQKPKPPSDKITLEQARTLRKNDYNKYAQMLREGKIESIE